MHIHSLEYDLIQSTYLHTLPSMSRSIIFTRPKKCTENLPSLAHAVSSLSNRCTACQKP